MERYIRLGINIDHVATVRAARGTHSPDPLHAAYQVAESGGDGITMHLREDRRHIQDRDVELVSERVASRLNLEMAATEEMLEFAERVRPDDCCIVPENRAELTTEGGLDVVRGGGHIRDVCGRLNDARIRAALFVDPDRRQIDAAVAAGAAAIELHTGAYANAVADAQRRDALATIVSAAAHAAQAGLDVHAGHGIDYLNVGRIAAVAEVTELNIGHAVVARALSTGLARAVSDMKSLMRAARGV